MKEDELSVVLRYDVNCLTHYMVVRKGLKSLTISIRFLYAYVCWAMDRRVNSIYLPIIPELEGRSGQFQ